MLRTTATLGLAALIAGAQPPQQRPPAAGEGPAKFTVSTQLIVETVTVNDKKGNAVEGLTAKDFSVTEDGKPQTIAFVEYQKLPDGDDPGSVVLSSQPVALPRIARTKISPGRPGDVRYRDHRLLVLYFDMTAMPVPDQFRALAAAEKFVRTQLTSSDLMAVMVFAGGAVQVLQDFTDDRDRLLTILRTLIVG
ncbi:MAG TPA: VWA domain-containing protein, partial [Anaerolineales bacterium]